MLNDKKSEVLTVKLFISLALVAPNASEKITIPNSPCPFGWTNRLDTIIVYAH